jgi:AraC family transcriptional regulator of adaptative response/methylated-DNA-[protein]-cysteine methyltransferase
MERDYERVASAIRYLNENAKQQPSLDQIARHMHLSPCHAQRLFGRWAGVSPKQFLQFLTVQHAKRALMQSHSLLATSYDLGLSGSGRLHDHFITVEAMTPQQYRSGGDGLELRYDVTDTPFGAALLVTTARGGICHLSFLDDSIDAELCRLHKAWPAARWGKQSGLARELLLPLLEGGAGPAPITLQLTASNFRLQVWQALLRIPEGCLVSYQQLAGLAGHPTAVRAVASAVAANPVAWLIPCHRVIRASGEFGNYRWTPERKQAMLAWESGRSVRTE